jgi:transcriptional repressor NrdR
MHCPFCRHTDTRVIDSRTADDGGAIRRRRQCSHCNKRFSTVEQMQLTVLKKSGATEPFDRSKAIAGVAKACKGRPVSADDLARLGQRVEDALRASGWAEVPAHEVGLAILGPLRELDEVAYLRFASVYRSFESADDFETEIAMLRAERSASDATDRDTDVDTDGALEGATQQQGEADATARAQDAPPYPQRT